MAKVVLTVRVHARIKAWVERTARGLNTTEAYIVSKLLKEGAGDALADLDPQMPHKDWSKNDS